VGVLSAIEALCKRKFGTDTLDGRRVTILGVGQVGSRLATLLAEQGARLTMSDVDPRKRSLAMNLGAQWVAPSMALLTETDVLVPAALGGILTTQLVPLLSCSIIVGPANNQLADPAVAEKLHARDIWWAPDFVVNAGGVIHGVRVDLQGCESEATMLEVSRIGRRLDQIFDRADAQNITPYAAAVGIATERLSAGMDAES
jgi:leucine dehydrogenase